MFELNKHQLPPRSLAAILIGFLIMGGIYTWLTPPFEGPDEPQHFAYIEWLALGKGFPPQGDAAWDTPIEQEAGQPPLYYLLASIPARLVGVANPPAIYRPNPYFVGPVPRTMPDNDNRALHYPGDGQPLRGGWLALYLARGLSLSFGVALIVFVYGLAREVAPGEPRIALASAFLVAVTPQVIFISSVASNDIAAAAFSTLTLLLLARRLRREAARKGWLALGGAFGLAVLCKASALALAAPIAVALTWLWLGHRQKLSQVIRAGLWLATAFFLVAGWWYVRSWWLYGTPLGIETHDNTPWAINDPSQLAEFIPRWHEVFRSYWIVFGRGTIRPAEWVYDILGFLTLLSVIGLGVAGWRWWKPVGGRPRRSLAITGLLALLLVALFVVALLLELWMRRVIAPHGRLLFPAAAAVTILLVVGWWNLHPGLCAANCAFMAVLAAISPFFLLAPAYTPSAPLTTAEIANLSATVRARFGDVAELVSLTPLARSIELNSSANAILPVELCWRALTRSERNYTVLLHVIGPENSLIADRRTYPGLGLRPTAVWQPGKVFCETVRVTILPHRVPRTLVYYIEVAMWDEERGERLPAYGPGGEILTRTFFDRVRLSRGKPTGPLPVSEEPLQLLDYHLATAWRPGSQYTFTLKWGATQTVAKDYTLFVHLRDPANGQNVAQADGPPLDGWYPTSWWPAGEIIVDDRIFPLPEDVPVGNYDLVVGWYDPLTGERLGPEHHLGMIEVMES